MAFMKLPQITLRNLFWPVLVVGMLALGAVVAGLAIPRSTSYVLAADFDQLPQSDEELLAWIRKRPGVVEHTVHSRRSGTHVEVGFIQVKNLFGQPSFPDLESKVTELGYRPESVRFVDVVR